MFHKSNDSTSTATGMLWLSNTKKPLQERLQDALAYCANKYGRPSLIQVDSGVGETAVDGIPVRPFPNIIKDHFFLVWESGNE